MNIFRTLAITLPMTFLLACGGGNGTIIPQPMPVIPIMQPMPDFPIADVSAARTLVGGSEIIPVMTSEQIEQTIQMRADDADHLIFSDIFEASGPRDVSCSEDTTICSGSLSDGTNIRFSLDDVENGPEINNRILSGYNETYAPVMTRMSVTLGQRYADGRLGNAEFEFRSYGGWLDDSVFAIQFEKSTNGNDSIDYFTAYSFGKETGLNPAIKPDRLAIWLGVMVGMHTETNELVQGDARISFLFNNTTTIEFTEIKNLVTEAGIPDIDDIVGIFTEYGKFETLNGDVKGAYYGDGHSQVGGVFNRDNILGAFGGVREE